MTDKKTIIYNVFLNPRIERNVQRPPEAPEYNHFLIDTGKGQVFCCHCRARCSRIALPRFVMYWCPSSACENTHELREMPDKSWKLHQYSAFQDVSDIQAMMARLVEESKPSPEFT